jgi:hypothetical protein
MRLATMQGLILSIGDQQLTPTISARKRQRTLVSRSLSIACAESRDLGTPGLMQIIFVYTLYVDAPRHVWAEGTAELAIHMRIVNLFRSCPEFIVKKRYY